MLGVGLIFHPKLKQANPSLIIHMKHICTPRTAPVSPLAFLAMALLAAPGWCGVWTVDDDGGTGIDFVDIQSAINSASHGDKIIVYPGTYAGFNLNLGVTILGSDAANTSIITSSTTITGIPGPRRAILTGLSMERLQVLANPGHVVLDNLELGLLASGAAAKVNITNSADVRMVDCSIPQTPGSLSAHGLEVVNSRLEVSGSQINGNDGFSSQDCFVNGENGGDGLWGSQGSLISIFQSDCRGGRGGDTPSFCEWSDPYAGDGGHGLYLRGGSSAVIAGQPINLIQRGSGGYGEFPQGDGYPGDDMHLRANSYVQYSGVTVSDIYTTSGASATQAIPADPFLDRTGTLQAGRQQTFWIYGTPGDIVTFYIGRSPAITIDPLQELDDLVSHERAYTLGAIPATGRKQFLFTIPAGWPTAFDFYVQAATTDSVGTRNLTNSMPIILRHLP
jgi:hypothetical protein